VVVSLLIVVSQNGIKWIKVARFWALLVFFGLFGVFLRVFFWGILCGLCFLGWFFGVCVRGGQEKVEAPSAGFFEWVAGFAPRLPPHDSLRDWAGMVVVSGWGVAFSGFCCIFWLVDYFDFRQKCHKNGRGSPPVGMKKYTK